MGAKQLKSISFVAASLVSLMTVANAQIPPITDPTGYIEEVCLASPILVYYVVVGRKNVTWCSGSGDNALEITKVIDEGQRYNIATIDTCIPYPIPQNYVVTGRKIDAKCGSSTRDNTNTITKITTQSTLNICAPFATPAGYQAATWSNTPVCGANTGNNTLTINKVN